MAFVIDTDSPVTREEFDRLYAECFDYISVERQRLGDETKEKLWETLTNDGVTQRKYMLDDYLVGVSAIQPVTITWQGELETWMWYLMPTYGQTEAGSRSWWYSEDFQKVGREWCDAMGFDKVMAIHNPTSPAALAVANTWGRSWDGRQYFEPAVAHTLDEVFGDSRSDIDVPDTMRAFVIAKHTE